MLSKCQLILATGGTVAQDLTMQWSTLKWIHARPHVDGYWWRTAIRHGPWNSNHQPTEATTPYPLDRGRAANTGRNCPNGPQCQEVPPAPDCQKTRASERQKLHMPSNLAEAMIRLLDDSSNEGLHLLNQTLRNSEHVLGRVWTEQLSPNDEEDLERSTKSFPGLNSHFRAALPSEQAQLPTKVDATLLEGTTINFSRSSSASPGCYNM